MQNYSRDHALRLDEQDPLKHLRKEFIIPSKDDLTSKTLFSSPSEKNETAEPCIYLCGNSLGLQPRRTAELVSAHLSAWAKKAVTGHMIGHDDSELPPFLHVDEVAAEKMAPIVGALKSEVAVMETLTANLHFLMASFYRPSKEKYKVIWEGRAFPSDHYAIESQIRHHEFDPKDAMILIEPLEPDSSIITTSHIISTIDQHASSTALILLPGVQYYTGQYLDIKRITAHAHSRGIIIGWDLAHAVGNVDVQLHDWEVDFAAWCNYKYVNSGPGAIAGLFVHSKHGTVDPSPAEDDGPGYRSRFCGWWGHDKATRFEMGNKFAPIPGAAGFQVGNPSALAITALLASLEIFSLTSMSAMRTKSINLTKFLEDLLLLHHQPQPEVPKRDPKENSTENSTGTPSGHHQQQSTHQPQPQPCYYKIITPASPTERGAQLSIRFNKPGLLEGALNALKNAGIVVDARKPDVIRVAPAPLYNTYTEVWDFATVFREVCGRFSMGLDVGGGVGRGVGVGASGGGDVEQHGKREEDEDEDEDEGERQREMSSICTS